MAASQGAEAARYRMDAVRGYHATDAALDDAAKALRERLFSAEATAARAGRIAAHRVGFEREALRRKVVALYLDERKRRVLARMGRAA